MLPGPGRGPEGPNFPFEERNLPYLPSFVVKIAILRQRCAKLGKYQGQDLKFSPSVVASTQRTHRAGVAP